MIQSVSESAPSTMERVEVFFSADAKSVNTEGTELHSPLEGPIVDMLLSILVGLSDLLLINHFLPA